MGESCFSLCLVTLSELLKMQSNSRARHLYGLSQAKALLVLSSTQHVWEGSSVLMWGAGKPRNELLGFFSSVKLRTSCVNHQRPQGCMDMPMVLLWAQGCQGSPSPDGSPSLGDSFPLCGKLPALNAGTRSVCSTCQGTESSSVRVLLHNLLPSRVLLHNLLPGLPIFSLSL